MSAWLTANLIALALFAWACIFKIIPSCNVSRFRYRLWRLRDAVVDEIHDGAFEHEEQPRRFILLVEGAIVASQELTPLKLLLMHWATRNAPQPQFDDMFQFDELEGDDKVRMTAHVDEFERATTRHLVLGSPSGWLGVCIASPFVLAALLRKRIGGPGGDGSSFFQRAKDHLREEIEVELENVFG